MGGGRGNTSFLHQSSLAGSSGAVLTGQHSRLTDLPATPHSPQLSTLQNIPLNFLLPINTFSCPRKRRSSPPPSNLRKVGANERSCNWSCCPAAETGAAAKHIPTSFSPLMQSRPSSMDSKLHSVLLSVRQTVYSCGHVCPKIRQK